MASDTVNPSVLARTQPGTDTWKAAVSNMKIVAPAGHTISSVESLAKWLKERDPEETWIQSRESQNAFLQHARDAVMRVVDKRKDGQYITTWVKARN